MPERVQILRPVNVADAGGMNTTYNVVTVTHWSGRPTSNQVKCRVAPSDRQQQEQVIGGALQGSSEWRITVPALTPVQSTDRLSVGSALSGSGLTEAQVQAGGGRLFQVLGSSGPRSGEINRIIYANETG